MRADYGADSDRRVVPKMKKETRDHRAGVRADKREDNAYQDKQSNNPPRPAELRTVHEPEQKTSEEHAGYDAKGFSEEWIEIAPKDSLFDERSDKHRHGHKQDHGIAVLEELLDGHVFFAVYLRAGKCNENGQTAAGEKVDPWATSADEEIGL